jgi:hypothetical protein
LEPGHGHEYNRRCQNDTEAPIRGNSSDERPFEQDNREGNEVENAATPLVATREAGNHRRWIPEEDEPLTQQPERIASVQLRQDPNTDQGQQCEGERDRAMYVGSSPRSEITWWQAALQHGLATAAKAEKIGWYLHLLVGRFLLVFHGDRPSILSWGLPVLYHNRQGDARNVPGNCRPIWRRFDLLR